MITCQGLVKIYKVADLETVALQGLDLEVARGELLAVIGNSGSGKTTLLNILGGLDRPSAGRVSIGGLDLLKLSDPELARYRRETVGFVWQQSARNLFGYLTARENVEAPQLIAGKSGGAAAARAAELLDVVGLADRMGHRPPQLSGGEQQRVAIAVALANNPPLLLADEPTGEVDSATAATVYAALRRLNRAYGTTVVIVSHDRTIASRVDRVIAVRDGKVSTETTRHEVAGETAVEEELIVVDAAGRLQIPRDLIEQAGIGDRVRVEIADGGIIVRPAGPHPRPPAGGHPPSPTAVGKGENSPFPPCGGKGPGDRGLRADG